MGFFKQETPTVDIDEWRTATRSERIRPLSRFLAESGFGTPDILPLLYLVKNVLFVFGGVLFALSTTGIDGFTAVGWWWTEPIVFQKAVLYTMFIEVVGLGCRSFRPSYTKPRAPRCSTRQDVDFLDRSAVAILISHTRSRRPNHERPKRSAGCYGPS